MGSSTATRTPNDHGGAFGAPPWRGVFAVLTTPFHAGGALDLDGLDAQAAYCVAADADGVVANVNASEYWTLCDDERRLVAERVVRAIDRAIPVIIGVAAGSAPWAAALAAHASDTGADAVIAMPPGHSGAMPRAAIVDYFERIAEASQVPVFVQNYHTPASSQMAPELVAELVREIERVDFIKEEAFRAGQAIETEIELAGPKLRGIMGGLAGRYMIDEFSRGSCGTMPACEVVDVHVQVWRALEAGDRRAARDLFNRLLPLLNYEALTPGVYKTVLRRRGVLHSSYMRSHAGNPLDASDERELSHILHDMSDMFLLAPPK